MNANYTLHVDGYMPLYGAVELTLGRPLLAYVLRNFERMGMSRPTQNGSPVNILGLPDTTKLSRPDLVDLTEDLQWFWFELLVKNAPTGWTTDQLLTAWASLTHGGRAFTNGHGWNNGYCDFVRGVNMGSDPMKFEPIVTGGNVVSLVSTDKIRIGGVDTYQIHTLDASKDTSTFGLEDWFIYKATISRREGFNSTTGKWTREDKEIPFPQLGGNDVPVPLLSRSGTNYINTSRVRILSAEEPIPPSYIY